MDGKVLVAYASRYGATAGIAGRVGEVLQEENFAVDVRPVEEVRDLSGYRAVVLGSAVYAGQWLKEAADFLNANEQDLAQRPVWLFSSGPTGEGDPVELMKGWRFPESLQPAADRVHPLEIAFFSGEINPQKLNLPEKLIVKVLKAPEGDYRNWEAIENWARTIADVLKGRSHWD